MCGCDLNKTDIFSQEKTVPDLDTLHISLAEILFRYVPNAIVSALLFVLAKNENIKKVKSQFCRASLLFRFFPFH